VLFTRPASRWPVRRTGAAGRLTIDPAERRLGGRVSAILWVLGGLTLLLYPSLPGVPRHHLAIEVAIAGAATVWGAISLLIDWRDANPRMLQLSSCLGLAAVGGAVWATGGSVSSAWIFLFCISLFAGYFYERPVAIGYLVAALAIQALPVLYDPRVLHDGFLAQLLTASAGYATIGGAIIAGRGLLDRLRHRAERLAAEQRSLRRVATAVVGGEDPERIYALSACELAGLIGAGTAAILQITSDGGRVLGSWSDEGHNRLEPGHTVPILPDSDFEQALLLVTPVRCDRISAGHFARSLGCAASVIAPISVRGLLWGAIFAGSAVPGAFSLEDEQRLTGFSDLAASAVANVEDRARLAAQALLDPLTGLANQRALYQRLDADVASAIRHDRPLSVAMLDVDRFKEINDTGGHEAGDSALRALARCLSAVARTEDTVGRAGGDEFMWILPDTTGEEALVAVERARRLIAETVTHPGAITASAGICDLLVTSEPTQLVRLADAALYSSKAAGRDRATLYDADLPGGDDSGAGSREAQLERDHALHGLRALARAIDAKDAATSQHSERVSAFAGRLAQAAGWPEERVALLREAALVHDVGKIGVPDAVLRKPGRLTGSEWSQMKLHAELSAQIVGSVLTEEQVHWIHRHHERPDGGGYPAGVGAEAIPDGAGLIALADAWDVMCAGRPYSPRRSVDEALAECRRLAGHQFTEEAVRALLALHESGALTEEPPIEAAGPRPLASAWWTH
jgi:diguanylate cyclase (GGDEF)-like protein